MKSQGSLPRIGRRPGFAVAMQVVDLASEIWGISALRLIQRERTRSISYPRFAVIWALRQIGMTWWDLADHLGFKDHKSVMYAYKQAENFMARDTTYCLRANALLILGRRLMETKPLSQAA